MIKSKAEQIAALVQDELSKFEAFEGMKVTVNSGWLVPVPDDNPSWSVSINDEN